MDPSLGPRLIPALVLGLFAAILSRSLRFLSSGGSAAAGLLAVFLFGFGGWQWLTPILFFFLSSSILSRIKDRVRPSSRSAFEKGSERDALQVLANGGVGGVLILFWHWQPGTGWYAAYLGSLAAATADTWGTELGMLSQGRPVLVTTLERVEAGVSGAVSFGGVAGGAVGAALVALCGSFWFDGAVVRTLLVITGAGIAGSFADSFLGAMWQVQYRCASCGSMTERTLHCAKKARYDHGARWLTNDLVNLFCNLAGAILAFLASTAFV